MEAFKYSIVIVDAHTSAASLGPRGLGWQKIGGSAVMRGLFPSCITRAWRQQGLCAAVLPVSYQADLCCKLS